MQRLDDGAPSLPNSHTLYMPFYDRRTKSRLGGPIRDYIGFLGGPIKGYTTNLGQGSYAPENRGFIGSHLVEHLLDLGYTVRVFDSLDIFARSKATIERYIPLKTVQRRSHSLAGCCKPLVCRLNSAAGVGETKCPCFQELCRRPATFNS